MFFSPARFLGVLGLSIPGFAHAVDPAVEQSHRRMLAALEDIAARVPEGNGYLGDRTARRLSAFLNATTPSTPPAKLYQALVELGREQMNLGTEDTAIRNLPSAREIFPYTGLPPKQIQPCLYFLAVALLRLGETENCCRAANPDSCLFPIRGGGTHGESRGSTGAIEWLTRYLETPDRAECLEWNSIWMLNIAHMTLGTYPDGVPERW